MPANPATQTQSNTVLVNTDLDHEEEREHAEDNEEEYQAIMDAVGNYAIEVLDQLFPAHNDYNFTMKLQSGFLSDDRRISLLTMLSALTADNKKLLLSFRAVKSEDDDRYELSACVDEFDQNGVRKTLKRITSL
jgi:hypothetical protein